MDDYDAPEMYEDDLEEFERNQLALDREEVDDDDQEEDENDELTA